MYQQEEQFYNAADISRGIGSVMALGEDVPMNEIMELYKISEEIGEYGTIDADGIRSKVPQKVAEELIGHLKSHAKQREHAMNEQLNGVLTAQ